jgi:hypothetical protein
MDGQAPDLLWLCRFSIPFSYAASKNHIYAMRYAGHVALRRESREFRQRIIDAATQIRQRQRLVQAKVWIDLLIQKPNHKGDAVNVLDLVCDGLKAGLGIDDRWFCIRRLDWQIIKHDPKLIIGVGQVDAEDQSVCSHCGRILGLERFHRNRHHPLGIGRACKDCRSTGRKLANSERALAPSTDLKATSCIQSELPKEQPHAN